jgi:hypothetical protein
VHIDSDSLDYPFLQIVGVVIDDIYRVTNETEGTHGEDQVGEREGGRGS